MFTSYPRFTRVLTVVALSTGFIANAHARPADLDWKPGVGAIVNTMPTTPQRNLGAPFYGPRQTIPSRVADVAPPQADLRKDAVRWVGPRNTTPVLR